VKALAAVLAILVASQYFAAYIFLMWFSLNPRAATPLTVARYAYYYGARADVQRRAWVSSAGGLALALLPAVAFLLPKRRPLYGEARFSSRAEVRRAGLLHSHGIILSSFHRKLLRLRGQQGVAVIARSRKGKGVGIVLPNLLDWRDSVICVDPKKENYTVSAGFRQRMGQAVYLFEPFSESRNTARWNPLGYVSDDPALRVNGLQRIADMLYPETPGVDPFWIASARTLFLGIALYVFETPSLPKTIGEILRLGMASDDEGFAKHWKRIVEGRNSGKFPLSPECVRALYDVIDLAPVTASSIRKTFTSRLDLWLNPILDWATSANDFDLRELRSKRMSIYVGVNPEDLHRLRPVLSLFFQQAIGLQTRQLPEHNPALKYQVMMLLDEFTALGKIPIVAEAVGFLGGYNIRVVLVIQARSQLREVYGNNGADTILRNLAARVVFGADDYIDAREISEELGTTTVKTRSVSRPLFNPFDSKARARSVNESEQRRPLMLPQEIQALGDDEALVFYEGMRPIRCTKIRYFQDRRFKHKVFPPPARAAPGGPGAPAFPPPINSPSAPLSGAASPQAYGVSPPAASSPAPTIPTVPSSTAPPPAADSAMVRVREATDEDIERIEELTLEDFATDFSAVEIPEKGENERMTEEELQQAVDSFLTTLREQ
jgi:type IV secretion system protein VirD4